jgi:hypothetical protein
MVFEVLMIVNILLVVFRVRTPRSLIDEYQSFVRTSCLHLQGIMEIGRPSVSLGLDGVNLEDHNLKTDSWPRSHDPVIDTCFVFGRSQVRSYLRRHKL